MILTVDIGNTQIKIGAWDHEHLAFVSRLQTNPFKTQDEYTIDLLNILQLNNYDKARFEGAIISNVVPPLSFHFRDAVKTAIQCSRVYLVSPDLKTGLNIRIDNPASLGYDMVCAAVAAIAQYPLPSILISMGTATAIFALDEQGSFLVGSLCAGVGIGLEALSRRTAQLPFISLEEPGKIIGTSTVDCMKSGTLYGTACMVDGMITRMKAELGSVASVVACGGFAQYIVGYCIEKVLVNDDMVLEGLRLIYYKNARSLD